MKTCTRLAAAAAVAASSMFASAASAAADTDAADVGRLCDDEQWSSTNATSGSTWIYLWVDCYGTLPYLGANTEAGAFPYSQTSAGAGAWVTVASVGPAGAGVYVYTNDSGQLCESLYNICV